MAAVSLHAPTGLRQWARLYTLYLCAFPRSERKPFFFMVKKHREGTFEMLCILKDGRFAGLAFMAFHEDLVLVDYLAVSKSLRGSGVGSGALAALRRRYPGKRLFLEIESVYEDTPERPQRLRRKHFYLENGMTPMGVMVRLFGVPMELLGFDCSITYEQYHSFYLQSMGAWAADHIQPLPFPEEKPWK